VIALTVNGTGYRLEAAPDMPLLWAIRELVGLTGTKYACGIAQCGACTVHLDGAPVRACITPVAAAAGRTVTTIEGLAPKADHPLQRAWI
jgi:isoquinoline 1-oxidoreductase alpha subunit